MAMVAWPASHQEGGRSIDNRCESPVGRSLVLAIKKIDDRVEFVVYHSAGEVGLDA
jgi:hypothetical protein